MSGTTAPLRTVPLDRYDGTKSPILSANDNLKLFALCDCALLYANPAQFFVETLEKVKAGNLKIIDAEDFYSYLYRIKLPNGQLFRDSFEKHLEWCANVRMII